MRRLLLGVSLAFMVIIAVYLWAIAALMPALAERGLFGDSLGGLNALFSGVALIGVVYALYLQQTQLGIQKKDNDVNLSVMREQLQEMQRSLQLQHQPVLQIQPKALLIHKPRVFHGHGATGVCACPRFVVQFEVCNASGTPATDITVTGLLIAVTGPRREEMKTAARHLPVLSQNSCKDENLIFVPDQPYTTLIEAVRNEDAARIPVVKLTILYRNLMGGCFQVKQEFHVLSKVDGNMLANWQTTVASFPVLYKTELDRLQALAKEPSRWQEQLDALISRFADEVADPSELALELVPIPGAFQARCLTESEYSGVMAGVYYPRKTFAHTLCLFDDDTSRSAAKNGDRAGEGS